MDAELERLTKEVDAQDGTDPDADDLEPEQWAKVKAHPETDYGSLVEIVWQGDMEGIEDHGYLTTIPGRTDTWDMIGIVHVPSPWVEKERPEPEWARLYSLCRNEMVREIRIGKQP